MSKNIVVISEDQSILELLYSKISVIKRDENFVVSSFIDIRKNINDNVSFILINAQDYSSDEIYKILDLTSRVLNTPKVLVLYKQITPDFVEKCFEKGAYDFIDIDAIPPIYNSRILNCLRYISKCKEKDILYTFINSANCIKVKTGFYTLKAFKECFVDLMEHSFFRNGSCVLVTLDESVKTKVSMNRLAMNIKKNIRETDVAVNGVGKYYLFLPDTSIKGAESVIAKIAGLMGRDIVLHSGICSLSSNNFASVDKKLNDALKASILDDKLFVSFENDLYVNEDMEIKPPKGKYFKLFKKSFDKKFVDVIEPMFYRFEKTLSTKLSNTNVTQYTNKNECVFSLKHKSVHSKLIICHDGFSKIKLKIVHKGLDTPENTELLIPLNEIDVKSIENYLNQLYSEFLLSVEDII